MPHHERSSFVGRIVDVFAHRFVVEADDGRRILADIGPKGADIVHLEPGLSVRIEGEQKPSELKVDAIAVADGASVAIPHKPKPHHGPKHHHDPKHEAAGEPGAALAAVRAAGYEPLGAPRRKPKHFEVLGRRGGDLVECHIGFDGHIRKEKPVAPLDEKWADAIKAAA